MCNRAFAGPESTLQNFTKTSEENIKVYEVWLSQQKIFIINLFQMLRRDCSGKGRLAVIIWNMGKQQLLWDNFMPLNFTYHYLSACSPSMLSEEKYILIRIISFS